MWRHQEPFIFGYAVVVFQKLENRRDIFANRLIRGEQRKIRVETRRLLVEVSRANVTVVADPALLFTLDREELAMHL